MRDYYPLLNSTHIKPHILLSKKWPKKSPILLVPAGTSHAFTVFQLKCSYLNSVLKWKTTQKNFQPPFKNQIWLWY